MAIIMTIAMVLTSANLPQISIKAKAAVTPPAENMKDTSILTVKGDDLSSNLEIMYQERLIMDISSL